MAGAIQDPTRRGILLNFYKTDEPLTVDQVATRSGVHRTVAFSHLERLTALGYLISSQRRGLPGKPAKLYQRASDAPLVFRYPARQFVALAKLLAVAVARSGRQAAIDEARQWGASLLARRYDSLAAAVRALDFLGADYHLEDDGSLVARNCIFREVCASEPSLVCGMHSAILEGALTSAGFPVQVTAVDPPSHTCNYTLTPN